MYNTRKDLLDAFRSAPTILEVLLAGCTQEQARAARGGDENWSVVEVVCHLRDAEEHSLERMRRMRDEPHPSVAGLDQEALARERNYAEADLHEALSAFVHLRAEHVAELEALAPEEWERGGRHEKYGNITISAQTTRLIPHDYQHLAQIASQLTALGGKA